ncbi:ITSN [Lepeophtheirus salmonis]|uniref:ITSN n=1 Tax=Lepeophtheirus salmonis TaxID=72036 RepID=A0A7R8CWI6_LEPSM|nr:ITSN [Lepeophtheirus salmonis]CAF2952633.1 ITSN [Lepeophtheirus salmonis]
MDWSISPVERQRHGDQFSSIGPVDGYLKYGPLLTWTRTGFEVPRGLPPSLLHPLPMSLPVGGVMPAPAIQQPLAMPRMMPPSHTMLPPNSMMAALPPSAMPPNSMIAALPPSAMPPNSMMPQLHPSMMIPVSMAPVPNMMNMQPIPTSIPVSIPNGPIVPTPTSMSLNMQQQMVPMHDGSGSSTPQQQQIIIEWGIPPPTRVKYATVFNQSDRARTGFLAGVPARNILLRSGLPQNTLAQIWALSDADNDGRLSLEEFILSGYLCDLAQKGEPMPNVLPSNLLPPSQRKNKEVIISGTASSGGGVGTPSSVKSAAEELSSPTSFEDKRRENFNKGHAELERRRQNKESRKKVLFLKAKQDNLKQELEANREKVKNLTTNISDTRSGCHRLQLKDQNARLISVTQEKAKLEARKKEKEVNVLREKLAILKNKEEEKKDKYNSVKKILLELEEKLKLIIEVCRKLFSQFDEQRREVRAEKAKRIRELTDPDAAWGVGFEVPTTETVVINTNIVHHLQSPVKIKNILNIVLFHPGQDHEPGWLGGELNGRVGWFPEAYAERVDGALQPIAEEETAGSNSTLSTSTRKIKQSMLLSISNDNWWQGESSEGKKGYFPANFVTTEHLEKRGTTPTEVPEVIELGDLTFDQGDIIYLVSQAEDWWTGRIGDRTGVFPFNYVEIIQDSTLKNDTSTIVNNTNDVQELPVKETESQEVNVDELPESIAKKTEEISEENSGKSPEIATVVAPYEATSKEQISLQKGQMILIKKKNSTGWWQGEVQGGKGKKRQLGWFPANYVKIVGGLSSSSSDKQFSAANTPASQDDSTPKVESSVTTEKQTFRALFPYIANHEDELAFEADDIITLISKEEEAWWKGEYCRVIIASISTKSIKLLVFVAVKETIKPDPDRLTAHLEMPIPIERSALKRVLGMFSYYAKWISRYSDKVQLLINAQTFPLSEEEVAVFENRRHSIMGRKYHPPLFKSAPLQEEEFRNLYHALLMPKSRYNLVGNYTPWYFGWANCDEDAITQLRNLYQKPNFLPEFSRYGKKDWFFIGSPGYGAPLHLDNVGLPSWQAQISGMKKWFLKPPPECAKDCCTEYTAVQKPGDILFIDTNTWYHGTEVLDGEVSITVYK